MPKRPEGVYSDRNGGWYFTVNVQTYTARLEREKDGRWTVELEEEPRVHTWSKTVHQALARVRGAAAL